MEKLLLKLEKWTLYLIVGIFPVFVLNSFVSPFIVPKEILLVVGLFLALLFWGIRAIIKGSLSFALGKFDLGVLLLGLTYLISAIFKTPNKAEAFLYPGIATYTLAGAALYFVINQLDKKAKESAIIAVFASALILSLTILLAELGVFAKIPQPPAFIKDSSFNPLGGLLPSAIYLISLLPIAIVLIIKQKDLVKRLFFTVSTLVIIFAIVISAGNLIPGKPQFPKFPSINTSWQIMVETIKVSPLLGIGPANYLTAFNLYRPLSYNSTDLWQIRFSTASDFYLTVITETGILGLISLIVLLMEVYKVSKRSFKSKSWEQISIIILLLISVFLPSAQVVMVLLFVLLGLFSKSEEHVVEIAKGRVPASITAIPILVGIGTLMFFGTKEVIAEATFYKSILALASNDAKSTYNLMTQSVSQNPRVDRYHASLSQVDMALATSLASQKTLSDTDKTTITQLVQAAINEGKATVTLNPQRSGNWEVLAQIYRSIMALAQGADQYAIQTYSQAVALDPTNPNIRIALGGTYYALGRYDDAINAFKLATLAKPDLANAYYNLALAYREKKDFDDAIAEMQIVLTLVKKDSPDYTLAQTTLTDLEKNKPLTKATGSESLTTPQPANTTKPVINLPPVATPPAAK